MRILVHDYAGHPFPFDLSRELARRGHEVLHVFCASLKTGPTGSFSRRPDDPASFQMNGIELTSPLDKFSFVKRWRQENEYGRLAAKAAMDFKPDVTISGNTPLDAQRRLWKACDAVGSRRVFWVQDLIGLATKRIIGKKLPVVGKTIGDYYIGLEKRLILESDHTVVISSDFLPILQDWKVRSEAVSVIENWAPIDVLPAYPRRNDWSRENGYDDKFVFMYTGTMGMKHNPELLYQLARSFSDRDDVSIVIASAGLGASWLNEKKESEGLKNLDIIGFHDFDILPEALASADVLVAVLEKDADVYSVPSKVLAYLCAGRPILLAVPAANLAARIVKENEAGLVVEPDDVKGFCDGAQRLYHDAEARSSMGNQSRKYAETTFEISSITDQFENIFGGRRVNGSTSAPQPRTLSL